MLEMETVPLLRTEGRGGGVTPDRLLIIPPVGAGPWQVCSLSPTASSMACPIRLNRNELPAAAAETWAQKRCMTSLRSHSQYVVPTWPPHHTPIVYKRLHELLADKNRPDGCPRGERTIHHLSKVRSHL